MPQEGLKNLWFHGRPTAHTAQNSLNILRAIFPGYLDSLRKNVQRPVRSLELGTC